MIVAHVDYELKSLWVAMTGRIDYDVYDGSVLRPSPAISFNRPPWKKLGRNGGIYPPGRVERGQDLLSVQLVEVDQILSPFSAETTAGC